jgi:hypothetical protein
MKKQYSILIEYPESLRMTCDNPLWLLAEGYYSSEKAVFKAYEHVKNFKILKVKKIKD